MNSGKRLALASLLTASIFLLILSRVVLTSSVLDTDLVQEHSDQATPPLDAGPVVQTFVCGRPNLCQVELLPAIYPGGSDDTTITVRLTAGEEPYTELARWEVGSAQITANTPLRMTFSPIASSQGLRLRLVCEGTAGVSVGFWYSSINTAGEGQLVIGQQVVDGSLRATTRCRYDPLAALRDVGTKLHAWWWLALPMGALLLLPGYCLCCRAEASLSEDYAGRIALLIGCSLALWPILLLWSTVVGLRWDREVCLAATGFMLVWSACQVRQRRSFGRAMGKLSTISGSDLVVLGILVFTLALRMVQIRNLALPAWVDSTQHALIAGLITRTGQVPSSYEPFVPVNGFMYHFGFHATLSIFQWLSNLDIPDAMLLLGQVINAASVLTVYLFTAHMTRSRRASCVAALVTGLVSYMPAYYVSWGRYTQLTGMVILPVALVSSVAWIQAPRREIRLLTISGTLLAGLFLTHARVSVFSACFLAIVVFSESWSRRRHGPAGQPRELAVRSVLLAGVSLALCAPWLVRVVSGLRQIALTSGGLQGDPAYNAITEGFVFIPRNRELMVVAAVGVIWGLWHRHKGTWWVVGWVALVIVVVNPGLIGLPQTNLLNNATATISLFLPLAMLVGQGVAVVTSRCQVLWATNVKGTGSIAWVLMAGLAAVISWKCAWGMVSIVNADTVLATGRDLRAVEWLHEHTPSDAVFLTNGRLWQLGIYAGTDGGVWIPQLAERRTVLPPLPYAYGNPTYVQRTNAAAEAAGLIRDAQDPALATLLEQECVTHIYIGSRGGNLRPEWFVGDPRFETVYHDSDVWVFAVGSRQ